MAVLVQFKERIFVEDKDLNYPNVLFRVGKYSFLISGKHVSDIQNIPDSFAIIPNGEAAMYEICISFGRIIYIIDIKNILNIEKRISSPNKALDKRKLIILNCEPLKGMLVDEVLGVEKKEHFNRIEKKCAITPFVENFYMFDKTNEIIMELDNELLMQSTRRTLKNILSE